MSNIVETARNLASFLHEGQIRKSNGRSYFSTHLEEVASILSSYGADDLTIAVGYLHDAVEDSKHDAVTYISASSLPNAVLPAIEELSEDKSRSYEERKARAVQEISGLSHVAAMVKAADVLSNVRGIFRDCMRPGFWDAFKRGRKTTVGFYASCCFELSKREDLPKEMAAEILMILNYVEDHC